MSVKHKQGDFVHICAGPHTGMMARIRLTDGKEALLEGEGRNAGVVVSLKFCTPPPAAKEKPE